MCAEIQLLNSCWTVTMNFGEQLKRKKNSREDNYQDYVFCRKEGIKTVNKKNPKIRVSPANVMRPASSRQVQLLTVVMHSEANHADGPVPGLIFPRKMRTCLEN